MDSGEEGGRIVKECRFVFVRPWRVMECGRLQLNQLELPCLGWPGWNFTFEDQPETAYDVQVYRPRGALGIETVVACVACRHPCVRGSRRACIVAHVDLDALHGTKRIVERTVEGGRRAGKIYSQGLVRGAFVPTYASSTAEWSRCFPRSPVIHPDRPPAL